MDSVLFKERRKCFYLTTHSTHLQLHSVGHIVKDQVAREETHCNHFMAYSFRLAASDLLYAPFHGLLLLIGGTEGGVWGSVTIYVPISTEGSGTPTTRLKTVVYPV